MIFRCLFVLVLFMPIAIHEILCSQKKKDVLFNIRYVVEKASFETFSGTDLQLRCSELVNTVLVSVETIRLSDRISHTSPDRKYQCIENISRENHSLTVYIKHYSMCRPARNLEIFEATSPGASIGVICPDPLTTTISVPF